MKIAAPPPNKVTPLFPTKPSLKVEVLSSPPLFGNLVGGSLPTAERGGCTLRLFNNFESMFIPVNLVFFLKLRTLWTTWYLSLLLLIKNSFIKGSKKLRDILYNYLEAYSEPCPLSKIEFFVVVNQWEALNIFAKKLHLVYFMGFWMSLCVLITVYSMAKKIWR